MRVAIIGSRSLNAFDEECLPKGVTLIVSGGAIGIDRYAEKYAKKNDIAIKIFLPEYEIYGKTAPLVRNKLIVDNCDMLIAFWDGISRGTKYTIDYAKKQGKSVVIHEIKQ